MTSLPLVNGAALGIGGSDGTQAMAQLRRALANGLGSLQSAELALGLLLHGVGVRHSGTGSQVDARSHTQGAGNPGGVTAMASLLPQLHKALIGK